MRLLPRGWSSVPEKHLKEIMARGKMLGTEHKQLRRTLILTEDGNHSQMLGPALAGLLLLLGAGLGSLLPPTPQSSQGTTLESAAVPHPSGHHRHMLDRLMEFLKEASAKDHIIPHIPDPDQLSPLHPTSSS